MNTLKGDGNPIGALAVVTIDNPMCAATGHRICNDCMKSCIYQKQEPVDIPQVETRTLKDVLELPLRVRDLQPLDPVEPAELRPALSQGARPAARSWSSAWGRPGSRWPTT